MTDRQNELIDKAKISEFLEKYDEAIMFWERLEKFTEANKVRKILAEKFNEKKEYRESLRVYKEIGKIEHENAVKILRQKANKLVIGNPEEAQEIYISIGESIDKIEAKKIDAKSREEAIDYDSAILIWEELGNVDEAARIRKLKAEQGAVKVSQKVVQGNEVTEIKDSVLNRSNVGEGPSKMQELREAKALLDEGIIDEDEFKQMKKEILGK